MFLKKLLPADGNFFEQLNQHAGHMLDAAKALSLLIEHYPNTQLRQQYTQAVIDAEHDVAIHLNEAPVAVEGEP